MTSTTEFAIIYHMSLGGAETHACMCCNLTKTSFMEDIPIIGCGGGKEWKLGMQSLLKRQGACLLPNFGNGIHGQMATIEGVVAHYLVMFLADHVLIRGSRDLVKQPDLCTAHDYLDIIHNSANLWIVDDLLLKSSSNSRPCNHHIRHSPNK